ncbi:MULTISPECIES: hydrolase [unclassified Pseudomonas]|uniref:hydrolase n=1 Tax=unclassified Pseudomonas TaxID=196821 RepID=UPI00129EA0FD|nr:MULTISPECIES: hydrolase [unclassified Pseudomonas]MDH4656686.1 hydrolase [Pseudomonas sp. BN606]MRK23084.1 hydrolase [Pseudomonas sp. JG-B]
MRKLLTPLIAAILVSCLTAYAVWTGERPHAHYLSDLRATLTSNVGTAGASGNLLAIRPALYPSDYRDPDLLRMKLVAAFDQARALGLLNEKTVVALPDHIGTWMLLRDEKHSLYQARTFAEGGRLLTLSHPTLLGRLFLQGQDLEEALLRAKAGRMARDYQKMFGRLAGQYQVTILAGSILLPSPYLKDGKLRSGHGALYNVALAFSPDGLLLGEPFSQPWPQSARGESSQKLQTAGGQVTIARSWSQGYPQNLVTLSDGQTSASEALFLRGRLWRLHNAPAGSELTPAQVSQASESPGSHLLNAWLSPR